MEMYKEIRIEKLVAKVKLAPDKYSNRSLHGFGELHFYQSGQDEPLLKIKGWTIRTKEFGDKKVLTVVPPAYPSGKRLQGSCFINNKEFWKEVTKLFLDEYAQVTGGMTAEESEMTDIEQVAEEVFGEEKLL